MTALKTRPASAGAAYADDFDTWTLEQGARLRSGDLSGLDRETLAEEIERDQVPLFRLARIVHTGTCGIDDLQSTQAQVGDAGR